MRVLGLLLTLVMCSELAAAPSPARVLAALGKIALPAVVWCWGCGSAVADGYIDDYLDVTQISVGISDTKDSSYGDGLLAITALLNDTHTDDLHFANYVRGQLFHGTDKDLERQTFPQLETRLLHIYRPTKFADRHAAMTLNFIGYDYHNLGAYQSDGFTSSHLHWLGMGTPTFGIDIGVGDLGFVRSGEFQQKHMTEWAGPEADFSHVIFLETYANLSSAYFSQLDFLHPVIFSIGGEQRRTIFGDIDLLDNTDGDFTAIWERLRAEVEIIHRHEDAPLDTGLSLSIELSLFRQRLNAMRENGRSFSQRTNGHLVKFTLTIYGGYAAHLGQ